MCEVSGSECHTSACCVSDRGRAPVGGAARARPVVAVGLVTRHVVGAAPDEDRELVSVAQAVADAEAEALRAHEAGECHLSEWSCSHCEALAERMGP